MSGIPPPTGSNSDIWGDYTRPGDIHHSRCHSLCGFLIFWALFIISLVFLILGAIHGRPWIVTHSWDSTGQFCGYDNTKISSEVRNLNHFPLRNLESTPFLFFGSGRFNGSLTFEKPGDLQYCVKECPTADSAGAHPQELYIDAFNDSCKNSIRICPPWFSDEDRLAESVPGGLCICPYPTHAIFGRCVPVVDREVIGEALVGNVTVVLQAVKNVLFELPGLGQGLTATIDLSETIALWVGLSFLIGFFWIVSLRICAPILVYLVVILVPLVVVGIGVWLWVFGAHSFLFEDEGNSNRILAGVCFGIAGIIVLVVIFVWKRLKSAVRIIGIAGRALWGNVSSLGTPLISLFLLAIFWALSLASAVLNYTSAAFEVKEDPADGHQFLTTGVDRDLQYMLLYILVYLIFISVHVYFTNYYAQSAAVVDWYFMDAKGSPCNCRCFYGFALALTKGLGVIALSALVMTPLYILILICEYLDHKAKQNPETVPMVVQFLIKCLKCCLYCFENFFRYLNKALLSFSQIYNTGWWASAKLTMNVLMSDVVMVAILTGITNFVIFLSKLVVAAITTFGFVIHIKYKSETSGWVIPAFIVFFLAYIVAAFLLGLFTNVIDIVFVCYQSDQDLTAHGTIRQLYIDGTELKAHVVDLEESAAENTRVGDITTP